MKYASRIISIQIEFLKEDGSKERRDFFMSPLTVWEAWRKLKDKFQLLIGESTLYTIWLERGYKSPVHISNIQDSIPGGVPEHVDWHVFIKRVK